jgi:signal transduction histidine kinase
MLGLWAEWAALRRGPLEQAASPGEIRLAVSDLVVGLVLVGCGFVLWSFRPKSWIGLLLTLAGFTWFLGTFAGSGESAYADFGALFVTLHRGPLVHALLSYPSGRVDRRSERAAIAFAWVVSAFADVGETPVAMIALAAVLLVVGSQRFVQALGPQRRARLVPAAGSAAFATVLFCSAFARLAGSGASLDRGVLWAYEVVVAGIAIALTLDLLLGRWVEATVTGLVVQLGETPEAGTLRDRLADALGDRSLVLGYRLPDRDGYVDDDGRELELPEGDAHRRVTIVRDQGAPVAALVHDADVLADAELVRAVAAAARIAVANARLQAEVRHRVEELEASRRRVVEAGDAERRRLERELREGPERRLREVGALLAQAGRDGKGHASATFGETQAELERARTELHEFARGVHPQVLTERGLAAALRDLAARSDVPVHLSAPDARFAPAIEAAAYFVCSEALANVAKYADASSATIEVDVHDGMLALSVRDDGIGGAAFEAGTGLRGLADRVEALGGSLQLASPPDRGTRVRAEIPVS